MLTELPFVTADEIAEQFRPGRTTKTKSALETLRRRGLISAGITRPLQDKHGRARGTLRLYSTLVRDAAALAAAGNDVQARRLVAIAGRLERRRDALELADVLAAAAASLPRGRRTVALMCKTAVDEPAAAKQLARYAAAIDQARRSMPRAGQVALGHVASIKDMRADVKLLDGSIVPVLRGRLPIVGEQGVGAPVAIRWAELGSGVWMTAEAALEVPLADERIYPFERARDREPVTVPAGVLDGPATIRPSRRTTIIA